MLGYYLNYSHAHVMYHQLILFYCKKGPQMPLGSVVVGTMVCEQMGPSPSQHCETLPSSINSFKTHLIIHYRKLCSAESIKCNLN